MANTQKVKVETRGVKSLLSPSWCPLTPEGQSFFSTTYEQQIIILPQRKTLRTLSLAVGGMKQYSALAWVEWRSQSNLNLGGGMCHYRAKFWPWLQSSPPHETTVHLQQQSCGPSHRCQGSLRQAEEPYSLVVLSSREQMRAVSLERSSQEKRVLRRGIGHTSPGTTSPGLPATPVLEELGTPWELQEVSALPKMKSK